MDLKEARAKFSFEIEQRFDEEFYAFEMEQDKERKKRKLKEMIRDKGLTDKYIKTVISFFEKENCFNIHERIYEKTNTRYGHWRKYYLREGVRIEELEDLVSEKGFSLAGFFKLIDLTYDKFKYTNAKVEDLLKE